MAGLLQGHCHLKERLFKMGLTNSLICKMCLEKYESAIHILFECEAIAYFRFLLQGHYLVEPDNFHDASISRILHFIRSVGLLKDYVCMYSAYSLLSWASVPL